MLNPPYLSLGAELARELDRTLGDKRVSELELLRGMGRARRSAVHRYRQVVIVLFGSFVVATTVIATFVLKYPVVRYALDGEAPTRVGHDGFGHWVVASAHETKVVAFSDGSSVKLASGSRLRVIGTSRRGASVTVESGSAAVRVVGTRLTEYLAGVGPFSLAIGEGRVDVSWDPINELLDLVVHEGYVVISGCQFGAGRSVMAGKELGTRCTAQ